MMLRWFQLPVLLLASQLFRESTYVVFLLYFEIFLASFLIMFLAVEIAVSVKRSVHFS